MTNPILTRRELAWQALAGTAGMLLLAASSSSADAQAMAALTGNRAKFRQNNT